MSFQLNFSAAVAARAGVEPKWLRVLDGRLLSLLSLFDAVGRPAGLDLLYHHCVNDVLHVLVHNSLDGSPLDPVSFL